MLDLFPLPHAASSSASSFVSYSIPSPNAAQLESFFAPIVAELTRPIPRLRRVPPLQPLPVFPRLADVQPSEAAKSPLTAEEEVASEANLSPEQLQSKLSQEEELLRLQRMSLRSILVKLDSSFPEFRYRVDASHYPDYLDVVAQPISVSDILGRVNEDPSYDSVSKLLRDVDLLVNNVKEFSSHRHNEFRHLVNKACHLQDTALSMVAQLETKLVTACEAISKRRAVRKVKHMQQQHATAVAAPAARLTRARAAELGELDSAASASAAAASHAPPSRADSSAMEIDDGKSDREHNAVADEEKKEAVKQEETKGGEKEEESRMATSDTAADAATSVPAGDSASTGDSAAAAPPSIDTAAPAASPSPSPSPSPSSTPLGDLLPPPPPLQLPADGFASLRAHLVAACAGRSLSHIEWIGFECVKIVQAYARKENRIEAAEKLKRLVDDATL